jgi:hypothetical protein
MLGDLSEEAQRGQLWGKFGEMLIRARGRAPSTEEYNRALGRLGTSLEGQAFSDFATWALQVEQNRRALKRPGEGTGGHTTRRPTSTTYTGVIIGAK